MSKGKKGPMKMANGGMANGKAHMYLSNGGAVTDLNPGLRALQKERPDVVAKILKKKIMVAKLSTIRRKIRTGQKMGFSERARAVNKGLLPSAKSKSKN